MSFFGADNLVVLVPLTGDHDAVARPSFGYRPENSLASIRLDMRFDCEPQARQNPIDNSVRVFGSWIVTGYPSDMRNSRNRLRHFGPLRFVTVSTTAEYADKPASSQFFC